VIGPDRETRSGRIPSRGQRFGSYDSWKRVGEKGRAEADRRTRDRHAAELIGTGESDR